MPKCGSCPLVDACLKAFGVWPGCPSCASGDVKTAPSASTNKPGACASRIATLANYCCVCGSEFEFGESFCGKCGKARELRAW
jgi:hypothetical protein